jgi:hypothetical protein
MSSQNWDKVEVLEKEIDKLKESRFDQWTVPSSAFITFEYDDAKELAEDASSRNKEEGV